LREWRAVSLYRTADPVSPIAPGIRDFVLISKYRSKNRCVNKINSIIPPPGPFKFQNRI
jgi:hypothetical protein